MRILRIVGVAAAVLALPILGLITYASWESAHMVYPSLENESAFLRAYDPKVALMPFIYEMQGYTEPGGIGGGAGTKIVTHFAHFGEYFTIRADRKGSLMAAVNDNVIQRLRMSGARIINQSGTSSSGFQIDYESGKTIGSVAIQPLSPGAVRRNLPLPSGLEDVSLNLSVSEQWYPRGIPTDVHGSLAEPDR